MIYPHLTRFSIAAAERGWVPDVLTRYAMRRLCEQRRADIAVRPNARASDFAAEIRSAPIAPLPHKANEQHYEVPAEFFEHVLGRHRKYSCCLWEPGTSELDEAEAAALAATCQRAEIANGMEVLELGCGWGALSLWIAEHFPGCHVTAVSNSLSQRTFIESEAARRGLASRLRVITADMNHFDAGRRFDRVVSVEMFEHMRNYGELLRRIAGWLHPAGKLFVHIFCHRDRAYEFSDDQASDWMSRHFFTGGIMPSEDLLYYFTDHLRVVRQWRWNGTHYQQTANAWVRRLDANRRWLLPILRDVYGRDDALRWWRRWRMLFMAGAELFGYRGGGEWFVAHYLLEHAHGPTPLPGSSGP